MKAPRCAYALLLLPATSLAGSLDHRVAEDTRGVYSLQDAVPISLGLLAAGCALWDGSGERLGKTCWQAGESGVLAAVAAEGLQFATARRSPAQSADPNHWFAGGKGSFPSTHVSISAALVTPFIYQYLKEDPWVAALAVLPAYEMVARVKARQHWQTDVLAGAAIGVAVGSYEAHRDNPIVFSLLPGGAYIGLRYSF